MSSARTRIFLRLELSDALRSRWLPFTAAVYVAAFGSFVWLGLRESSVLGFTGMSRVVLNLSNALVLTLPLVALVSTNQSVVRARSSGFFELFLSQPCKRKEWLRATILSRLLVLVVPIAALLLTALVFGSRDESSGVLASMVVRSLVVSAALAWAFVAIGFLISSVARNPERATVLALLAWLSASMLHDFALIGALLQWRLPPGFVFSLAASNPVESARIAILSGVDPELSVLGPVGFWLANTLGPRLAFAIGAGWPLLLGAIAAMIAELRVSRMDLIWLNERNCRLMKLEMIVLLAAAVGLTACSKEAPKKEATAVKPTPAPVRAEPAGPVVRTVSDSDGRKAFIARCASCHGMEGKGDGPGAAALNPKPRNYTDREWQKTVTDEQIGKTIQYGGAAVGKSPIMPAQADLQSKPEMVDALIKVVRSFAK